MVETIIMSSKLLVSAFILSLFPFSNSCEKVGRDDKFALTKQAYSGNQLKINGYYYQRAEGKYYTIYFFYEDGVLLYGGGNFTYQELIEKEKEYNNEIWLHAVKKYKDYWGIYNIESNSISFERWYPSSGGPYPAYIRSGEILNDTTFVITKSIRSKNGKEKQQLNETYHFRKFSPKPDSTNTFIK